MSKPKGFEKPAGVRDYLPHAVAKLRRIEREVLACMDRWGYRQIMTPTMEYYDTVGVASSTSDQKLFKLLNNRGTTMVLRSDMTSPIARVVSSLLKEEPLPIRLSYHANVFRAIEEEAGRESEFFQTGVELVGDDSPEADAEVIALAIESLKAAGVARFKIAMGHMGFLNGLLQEVLPERAEDQGSLKQDLLNRDYVGYRGTIERLNLPEEQAGKLDGVLKLRGGREALEHAQSLSGNTLAQSSIRHLGKVLEVLDAYEVSEHVMIDLTMIGDFSYYTGMIFEGYAAELGSPVASGGRYDKLLRQFGRAVPSTGFALKTNRILDGVSGTDIPEERPILVQYTPAFRKEGLQKATELRAQGYIAVTSVIEENDHSEVAGQNEHQPPAAGKLLNKGYQEIITFK
ncbi:ATP phosphoribosyltransferase regulatory subunit [Paenibacillus campinasensis]|uniref:ATP phosphoribosyltransferase regulatory subunit n=1 Tax=Paenibacillus campinasensis TaxID=66347 RepID=A0A268EFU9_9BACL|nr:ATP phosphoribosyltransferase regulatory subunit [Paenibacillus campinasensis]PAD71959.1 ATP phosphoribosyltransferase regulatory subunit [Paenibacillus campinasensis]